MTHGLSASIENITPETAREYLQLNHRNRSLNERALTSLSQDMRSGDWKLTGEAIKFDTNNHLIDGQHRLIAIERTGIAVPILVIRGVDPDTQLVMDTGVRRTGAHALEITGTTKDATLRAAIATIGVTDDLGKLTTAASPLVPVTHSQIMSWVGAHDLDQAVHFGGRVHRLTHGSKSSICYAFYKISQIDPESARTFFEDVANMTTEGVGDPKHTLITKLTKYRDDFRGTGYRAKYVYYILKAWEASYNGRKLKMIRDTTLGNAHVMPDISKYRKQAEQPSLITVEDLGE